MKRISLHRWPNTAQDRYFRNHTNENWEELENTHNDIIEISEQSSSDSSLAKKIAEEANNLSNSVQTQLDTIVVNGDSSVEAAQARVDTDGVQHETLKDRNDSDFKKNEEKLKGVEGVIEDVAINLKKFGAVDGVVSNLAFSKALNSNYDSIILSKGLWKINDTITANTGAPKKIVGTKDSVISIDLSTSKKAFDIRTNIEFHNIVFDFNNKFCNIGLFFKENLGKITLKNCKFVNIKDMDSSTSTTVVYVANDGNSIDFSEIELENILKKGNGNITDAAGSLNGIYTGNTDIVGTLNGGIISNVKVKDFHNINDQGAIIYEDTAAIYLAGLSRADVTIKNVDGYNFGKRLIKTQVSNVTINNIKGESHENDSLSVVSTMDMDNISISNVQAIGNISVAVNTSCTNTVISNIKFNIDKASLAGPNSFGIQIGASNIAINEVSGTAERSIVFKREDGIPFRNITIDTLNIVMPIYGHAVIQFLSGSEGFERMTISNVIVENESVFSSNYLTIFDTYNLSLNNKSSKDLTINNVVLNSKYSMVNDNERMMNLYKITGVRLRNLTFINNRVNRAYRGLLIEGCSDVRVRDLDINAYVSSACQVKDCNDVSIRSIKAHSTTNYVSTVFNSTKVKFAECDPTRVLINDPLSVQNTTYEKRYSMGPSNLRASAPYVNDEHFDTTLGKPIWWSGSAWKDAAGNIV